MLLEPPIPMYLEGRLILYTYGIEAVESNGISTESLGRVSIPMRPVLRGMPLTTSANRATCSNMEGLWILYS